MAQVAELLIWYTLVKPVVTGSIPAVSHKFRIKQPNGTLSRMYVQTYIRVKWVAESLHSEAWNECSLILAALAYKTVRIPVIGLLHCNNTL